MRICDQHCAGTQRVNSHRLQHQHKTACQECTITQHITCKIAHTEMRGVRYCLMKLALQTKALQKPPMHLDSVHGDICDGDRMNILHISPEIIDNIKTSPHVHHLTQLSGQFIYLFILRIWTRYVQNSAFKNLTGCGFGL